MDGNYCRKNNHLQSCGSHLLFFLIMKPKEKLHKLIWVAHIELHRDFL